MTSKREEGIGVSPLKNAKRTVYYDDRYEPFFTEWTPLETTRTHFKARVAALVGIRPGGIGQAIARRLALKEGYKVLCFDRDRAAGQQAVDEIRREGGIVTFHEADLSTEPGADAFAQELARRTEILSCLICNAGSAGRADEDRLLNLSPAQLHSLFDHNVLSAYLAIDRALKGYFIPQASGVIVLLGSNNGQRGMGLLGQPAYGICKTALTGLLVNLVSRFGRNVRANLVRPGVIVTNSENWQRRLREHPDWLEHEGVHNPAGRLGSSEDVANAVAWLISDEASFVNGVELPVDAGFACAGLRIPGLDPDNFRESYVTLVRELGGEDDWRSEDKKAA